MDWYLLLIQKYGYLAILLGAFVEGDISLALGSIFARQGLMNLWLVIAMALIGSICSQSFFYFLGRWRGLSVIQKFPRLQAGFPKAHSLVQRFGSTCILIAQFLYGMRLATCFALGTLKLKTVSFIFWLLLALSVWAAGVAAAGYTFGAMVHYLVSRLQIFLTVIIIGILALVLIFRWFWKWTEHRVNNFNSEKSSSHRSAKILSWTSIRRSSGKI